MRYVSRGCSRGIVGVAGVIALGGVLVAGVAAQSGNPDASRIYAKKATWAETMVATRANYTQWAGQTGVSCGPWYTTGPLKAKGFGDALFPEKGVDLNAKSKKGQALWKKGGDWPDGQVHMLTAPDSASTYLYRTITVPNAIKAKGSFGSDDGIEVWLNGKKIHSNNVPRGPAPDQDIIDLDFKAGENKLLVKIFNIGGGHGFYFRVSLDPLLPAWDLLKNDFPLQARWMPLDAPNGDYLSWFRKTGSVDIEKHMIQRCLGDLGTAGAELRKEYESLCQANTSGSDPRWLAIYEKPLELRGKVCAARELLKQVNLATVRRAIEDLNKTYGDRYRNGTEYANRLANYDKLMAEVAGRLDRGDTEVCKQIEEVVAFQREALAANPLLDFDKLLVLKRKTNNLGLPQNWQGNCAVARSGYDNEIDVLSLATPGREMKTLFRPDGNGTKFVGDVDLDFDADKMLISMPDSHGRFQIWEIRADGSGLRQVTPDEGRDIDNYDACYLPDGRIMFASTRCFQGIPCVGGGNTVANLCIMNSDGGGIRMLCFDQDHNWCPTVLNNGRVLYARWEYSDTPHYFSRLLFHMNPDGTNQMAYYGSNSYWPNSTFYARPIPNHPTAIVAVVSGHHGVPRMGELVIFDPAKSRFEADGAVQRIPGAGKKVEAPIVDTLVDASWPRFLHPYPLSDKYFLVTCQPTPQSLWGIYLVDVFDNMTLIKEMPGYALMEPVPFRKTQRPPVVPDRVKPNQREGTVYLTDIYSGPGLKGVSKGTVKKLRIYEFHYTYPEIGGHQNIGMEGPWDVHRILGTVPVYEDGSAAFKVPANTPVAVQPLDGEGKALQLMRSWFVAMPGEQVSCVGCHESQNASPPTRRTIALSHRPSDIEPWYGPARGFSFKREVQPVLSKYCAGCHNGQPRDDGRKLPDFTARDKNGWSNFTQSYLALHPYVRRPGPESDYHILTPMEFHANTSELIQMLAKGHHGVKLDAEAWDRLVTWIDLNVPDHGTWGEHTRLPKNYHQRRMEMLTKYANRPEDPEAIPQAPAPVAFVKPEEAPKAEPQAIACAGWPFDAAEAKKRQASAGQPTEMTFDLGGTALTMMLIPAGEFVMGEASGYLDERPQAKVKIDRPFYMAKFEVTVEQFQRFDGSHFNGYFDQHAKDHTTPGYPAHAAKKPAIRVSWQEAMAFSKWLSEKTGRTCTLPTEAQWEWACRAGTATALYYGDRDTDFSPFANLGDVSLRLLAVAGINPQPIANPSVWDDFLPKDARFNDKEKLMAEVGKYQPNAWGLNDMHGNVWEWTLSTYRPYPYNASDGRNDLAAAGDRVVRGGSFYDRPMRARSAVRMAYKPYQKVWNVGFRVICDAPGAAVAAAPQP